MTPTDIRKLCIRLDTTEDRLYEALAETLDELDERRCGVLTVDGVTLDRLRELRSNQYADGARDSLMVSVRNGRLEIL